MTQLQKFYGAFIAQLVAFEMPSVKREEGQTLAEYAMILALIAIVVAGALIFLRGKIEDLFSTVGSDI
jgi:Flp pilus assembly pilin Flp